MKRRYLDLSTSTKLISAFGLTALVAGAAIVFAYQAMSAMRVSQRNLLDVEMANVVSLKDIRSDQLGIRAGMAEMMMATDAARREPLRADVLRRSREIEEELRNILQRKGSMVQKQELLHEFERAQRNSIETRETQILPLVARGRLDEARELFVGVQLDRDRKLAELGQELIDTSIQGAAQSVADSEREALNATRMLLLIAALALTAGVALTLLLGRVLAGPLHVLSEAAQRLAAGDLSVKVPHDSRMDEAGVLSRTFAQMVERLRSVMHEVGEGMSVLASSASEITASTSQVASSSAQTASAVAQTSATADEVKQTARVASEKAALVQETAQKTVQISQEGLRAMDDSIQAMHQIRLQMDSVAQSILKLADQGVAIGEIITTVNDLADQSNLLSVNAAIEAERAGEEGAGFRVVAQEIRSLAEQSKQATVQVRALLGDIQRATSTAVMATEQAGKAVGSGVQLSEGAARSIRSMADSIAESAQAAAQIAASAQQQAVGMDQVTYAMQSINEASAQNVAASRQTEAAAQGLHALGLRLKAVVDQYQR